jgi:phage host-nuclease inhibitor protein Gam
MPSNQNLLDLLTREGVLLNVSVRYWRAAKKLQAQDLGLDPGDVTDRLISLGHKRLMPKDALSAFALIESRAHSLVEAATFPFLNGIARFLPNRKLGDVTAMLSRLETEFRDARTAFAGRYASLREQALTEWREQAHRLAHDPERIVASVSAAFPAPDRLDRYFSFDTSLFQIQLPEALDAELVAAGDRQELMRAREQAAQAARRKIAEGAESFIGDCVATLREQTAGLCDEMLESFRSGKTGVHQRTLNRLTDFIDNFRSLNFANDTELEERLARVRDTYLTTTAEQYRDDAVARQRMTEGIRKLADAARELATQDTRAVVENFGRMGARRFTLAA